MSPRTTTYVLLASLALAASAQSQPTPPKEPAMSLATMSLAKGAFDVQVIPRPLDGAADDPSFARYALTKQFRGDLEASGAGQMLASGGPHEGAGAYVAIERVTGTLHGRTGSFVLQHRGTMDSSGMEMLVTIVPESGSGDLVGIRGTLEILFDGPQHLYELEYQLPAASTSAVPAGPGAPEASDQQ